MPTGVYKHRPPSDETRRKISQGNKGKHNNVKPNSGSFKKGHKHTKEVLNKISKKLKGRKIPLEVRIKIKKYQDELVKCGKHRLWKGGATNKNKIIRESFEYRLWREAVFERDGYSCVLCKKRGGKLNADHLKSFAYYPELRFAIDNGRTLCKPCHLATDNYGNRSYKYEKNKPKTKSN